MIINEFVGRFMGENLELKEQKVFPYDTVTEFGEDEIIEKKSRFIAHVLPVETEEEALAFIEKNKKQYWDARHNCFAFVIGKNNEIVRFSDDGEPSGTAGKPILEVLQKMELHNVVVVVTRYFGGVLLGTGGLVRAYTDSTKAGILAAKPCTMAPMVKISSEVDYSTYGKVKYILEQNKALILSEEYEMNVTVSFAVQFDDKNRMIKLLTEATNGHTIFEETEGELLWMRLEKL